MFVMLMFLKDSLSFSMDELTPKTKYAKDNNSYHKFSNEMTSMQIYKTVVEKHKCHFKLLSWQLTNRRAINIIT